MSNNNSNNNIMQDSISLEILTNLMYIKVIVSKYKENSNNDKEKTLELISKMQKHVKSNIIFIDKDKNNKKALNLVVKYKYLKDDLIGKIKSKNLDELETLICNYLYDVHKMLDL